MSRWAILGLGCGLTVVIIALLSIFFFFSAFHVPPAPITQTSPSTASKTAMTRATAQLHELEKATRSGVPLRQTIRLRDEDLNSLLAAPSTEVQLPQNIERAAVKFRDGVIHASSVIRWHGRRAYVELDIRPHVESDGTVRVTVEGGKVGRLPLPIRFRREIEEKINNEIAKNLRQGSIVIGNVVAQDGILSVDIFTRGPLRR